MTVSLLIVMSFSMMANAQNHIDLKASKSVQECTNVTEDGFQATFSFASIEATPVSTEKGEFSDITMQGTYPTGNAGEPSLPAAHQLLAVPYGATNISAKVTGYSTTIYKLADYGIKTLMPAQVSVRKDQDPKDVKFAYSEKAYASKSFSERPITEVEILGTMRGIQVGSLTINPVSYNPSDNTIKVYNDITVEVSYDQYDKVAAEQEFARTFSPYFAGIYKQMFNWRDDVYTEHPDLWQAPVKMLVIANNMFEECMQPWIEWKTTKGFYMDVNYTDEIGTTASAIQAFISQKYAEDAPTFVIIFGDKEQVAASATGSSTSKVTDLYYSSVDNDYFPDMFHSRMCAQNVADMTAIIEKTLEYEQYTMPDPSYLSNVLLIAGADGTWNPQVGQPTINYATTYYYNAEHGLNNVYAYLTSYSGCYNNLNTGVGFANYTAHGSETGWYSPGISVSDVANLTNVDKYFLAMGNCCLAADWGYSGTCFGEAMIRASQKGAYAYIGSCPSTYWYEDYYFGVGATNTHNGSTPTFEESSTGVYDGTWMDNTYNTVASVPFLGNLAVCYAHAGGYDTHSSPLYYWQAYHTLGDASVMPYNITPIANTVSHMSVFPIGMETFEVTADPGSYVAITKDGVIHGTGLVDDSGSVTVDIEPVTSGGDVTICVTRPQRQPYLATIPAAAMEGPYITCDGYELLNASHQANYGETIPMNITLKNVGNDPASNLSVSLSTESDYLILNGAAEVSGLAPNATYTIENAFNVEVSSEVPEGTKAIIFVNTTDGTNTWQSRISLTLHAPAFQVVSVSTENNLQPGDNGTMTITIKNAGTADATNAVLDLFTSSSDITFTNTTYTVESIAAGQEVTITAPFTIASTVENGSTYEIGYGMNAGYYGVQGTYVIMIGAIIEDFETGDFTKYDWQFSATPWNITTETTHGGTYAAKSGAISENGSTSMTLSVNVVAAGSMSFWYMVSSEANYDKLHFYIDGNEVNSWSGESAWTEVTTAVTTGTHTFAWTYTKDGSVSNGSDCAWIDDISFPPTNVINVLDPVTNLQAEVENDNNVTLTWTGVNQADAYEVRRDGVLLSTQSETTFAETLEDGIYTYCVVAKTNEGAYSSPAYVSVTIGITGTEENQDLNVNVYPNPSNGTFNINVNGNAKDVKYVVYNYQGQMVMSNMISNNSEQINLNGMAKGVYFLRIIADNQVSVRKLVVE